MSDDQKQTHDEQTAEKKTLWMRFMGLFDKNYFILIISLVAAVVIWFIFMMTQASPNKARVIYNVPITIDYSDSAQENGLKIYNISYNTANISVSGNSLVTSKLGADEFDVVANFSPSNIKVSGNAIQTETLTLKASKKNTLVDYEITSIDPEEITVEYDRSKEITLPIDKEIQYTTESTYHADSPILSDSSVIIKGPESSVNKISRVSAAYEFTDPLREETTITCELTLYGQDDKPITDYSSLYLELDTKTVEVTVPVNSKKTVRLEPNLINAPKGFANSRITVTPETIDIVGSEAELAKIGEIILHPPINFNDIDLTNHSFTVDIPIPTGVKSLSGDETTTAQVEVNLNGYVANEYTTTNFNREHIPAGKTATVMTTSLSVYVIGSEAQMAKLTGENIYVRVDLTNMAGSTGSFEVPAIVSINGADSCWATEAGRTPYMVYVTIEDTPSAPANAGAGSKESADDAATPND